MKIISLALISTAVLHLAAAIQAGSDSHIGSPKWTSNVETYPTDTSYIRGLFDTLGVEIKNLNWSLHLELAELRSQVGEMRKNYQDTIAKDTAEDKVLNAEYNGYEDKYCHDSRMNAFHASLEVCQRTCNIDDTCKAVVYWADKNICYKRSHCSEDDFLPYPGIASYLKSGTDYAKHDKVICPDTDMNAFHSSARVCKRTCHRDDECKAVVYWPDHNSCFKRYHCTSEKLINYPGINTFIKKGDSQEVGNRK